NEWAKGLELLASGNDKTLEALAKAELQKPGTADEYLKLGDMWWDAPTSNLDQYRLKYRQRAKYWYLKALGDTIGDRRAELATRILSRVDDVAIAQRPVKLRIRLRGVDTTHTLRISNDGIVSNSVYGGTERME